MVYSGICPISGELLSLPRTPAAEAVARELMGQLPELVEGRMFGVLLVENSPPLKAGSGNWEGPGWVPAFQARPELAQERETLARLAELKSLLGELARSPAPALLAAAQERWQKAREGFNARLRLARGVREMRRGSVPEHDLLRESRADKHEKRHFRARENEEMEPLRQQAQDLEQQRLAWVRERRQLSRELQARMHDQVQFFPFQGEPWSLASLFPDGPPTGVGECCAPKLLHYAARHGLRPLAMAEFWWGPARSGREPGQFYAACASRCQPLLGPLLSGLHPPLQVLDADADLVAVDKPSGVLSVPGRASWNQDSVLTRLRARFPELLPVHRLDLETTGLLVFARTPEAQRALQREFAARRVVKVYEALLEGTPQVPSGEIELALGRDPARPGCYRLDSAGKPAITRYRVLDGPRVEFQPLTGRSHQLRIHAAAGLGCPILGDRLYGRAGGRLRLHCRRLELAGRVWESAVPF